MNNIKLICITCNRSDISYEEQVELVCAGGADMVIFRDHELSARALVETARTLRDICRKNKVMFLVSGRADVSLAVEADGVHLAIDDISVDAARQVLGPRRVVCCDIMSHGQALEAAEMGASYIFAGPVFSAAGKGVAAPSIDIVRLLKKRVKVPIIAFGSITKDNAAEAIRGGADGLAVSRAVCDAADISRAAAEIKAVIIKTEKEQERMYPS